MKKVVKAFVVAVAMAFLFHAQHPLLVAQSTQPLNYFKSIFVTGDYVIAGVGLNPTGSGDITIGDFPPGKDAIGAFLYWQAVARTDTPDEGGVGAYFNGHPLSSPQGIFAKALGPGTPTCSASGGGTGNSQGAKRTFTYRMDVLRYFDVDQAPGPNFGKLKINGTHSVQLPASNTVEPIGASLVVMYRDEDDPLRAVVIYDGAFAMDQATGGMELTMEGFYDGKPGPARLSFIGGNGQANKDEITRFNGALLATNAFSSSLGAKWDNPTFDAANGVATPVPTESPWTDQVTVSVAQEDLGTFDCVTFAAAIYSTEVEDQDFDGLLDRWEESAVPLFDPNGQPLLKAANGSPTTLSAMDASVDVPDVFVEIGYMQTGDPLQGKPLADYSYGGVSKPAHSHLPGPDALKLVGKAFKGDDPTGDRVRIHFDIGNWTGTAYDDPEITDYLVPVSQARGGDAIDEWTTVCQRQPSDPEYVCQFGYIGEGNEALAYPGTVGWKTGYRFFRDEVFSISPPLPGDLPEGETAEDYCGQIANPDTGERYVCERRFDENRFNIFRYSLFSHHVGMPKSEFACLLDGQPVHPDAEDKCVNGAVPNPDFHVPVTASGIGDFPGADSQVSLGGFVDGTGKPIGTQFQQAGTLMHELGHQFLRRHGGGAFEPNCKPTYLSVMNYLYQLRGLLKDDDTVRLDYSDAPAGPTVNEAGLDPNVDSPTYRLGWFAPLETSYLASSPGVKVALKHCNGSEKLPGEVAMVRVDAPTANTDIDWDADGDPGTQLYAPAPGELAVQDVNYSGGPFDDVLAGSADWPNLKLNQIGIRRNVGALYLDPDTNLFTVGPTSVGMGKGDAGKGDAGVQDLGKGDAGKGDAGKGDAGKGDAGKGDAGKGDAGKGDAGGGDTFSNDPNNPPGELDVDTAGDGVLRRPTDFEACVSGVDCLSSSAPLHDVQITFNAPFDANPVSYTVYRVPGTALLPDDQWEQVGDPINHVVGQVAYSATDDTSGLENGSQYTYFARANYEVAQNVFASSEITRRDPITVIDDPAAAADDSYSTNEDTPLTVDAPGVLANDGDPDDPLVFTAELVTGVSPAAAGALVLNADGSFTFTPATNFSSADAVTFTYRAVSGAVVTNTATVSITVFEVNDPPTVSDIPDQTIYQNGTTGPIAFSIDDVENAAGLTVSGTSSNTALVPNANIVFGGAGGVRTVTVTPVANTTGAATITILVNDGAGGVASDTFVLNVLPPTTLVGIQNVPPASVKTVNPGSSVPMVWEYRLASTVVDSSFVHHTVTITGPQSASYNDTDSGSSYFRYDPTTRRWSFNLQTKTPTGENYLSGQYTVTITPQTAGFVGTSFTLRLR